MQINPRVGFYLSIVMVILGLIASGTASLHGLVSDPTANAIVGWCGFIFTIYGGVNTALHGLSSPSTGPLVKPQIPISPEKVAQALVLALLLGACGFVLLPTMASAAPVVLHQQHRIVKHAKRVASLPHIRFVPQRQKLSLNLTQLMSQLQQVSLDDLTAAKADADAQGDKNASACYGAISTLVSNQQKAVAGQANLPAIHLATTFQQTRDFALALRPGSALSTACAPVAQEVKMDVLNFIAAVTAGSLSLASFGL